METAAISYRVADFLKKHPPFQAMDEADLLELASSGRVRFFEAHDFIVSQGEPYRPHVFVIQQGAVTLWDEASGHAELRDVRGAGDLLGVERFDGGRAYPYAARSSSDVVIYAFPAIDFEALVLKYPAARKYVSAHGHVSTESQPSERRRDPQTLLLNDVAAGKPIASCDAGATIGDTARFLLLKGAEAVALVDSDDRVRTILTARALLEWIANGGGDAQAPAAALARGAPLVIAPQASMIDGVMALSAPDAAALAMTSDGTLDGRLLALVTPRDLQPTFGDQPISILSEIRCATDVETMSALVRRSRAFIRRYLIGGASFEWLARLASLIDGSVVRQIIATTASDELPACWCFCGASGRGESLTNVAPQLSLIVANDHETKRGWDAYQRVLEALGRCGYLPIAESPFEASFHVASLDEWKRRYLDWIRDPVRNEMYRARSLFDLQAIGGRRRTLWQELEAAVTSAVSRDFVYVLANDCLASLPPLTFFQDAVIDEAGEQTAVFRLEHSAARPLVDVGRVFGMAARKVMGTSTLERFAVARILLPEQASIFQEASDTLRIVLWQQGRIGISQGTDGSEVPPALLSRYDREILKSGFRAILRLLEFTADPGWLETL